MTGNPPGISCPHLCRPQNRRAFDPECPSRDCMISLHVSVRREASGCVRSWTAPDPAYPSLRRRPDASATTTHMAGLREKDLPRTHLTGTSRASLAGAIRRELQISSAEKTGRPVLLHSVLRPPARPALARDDGSPEVSWNRPKRRRHGEKWNNA